MLFEVRAVRGWNVTARRRAAALALIGVAVASPCGASREIRGVWSTQPTDKGFVHVRIEAAAGTFVGRIVWLSEADFPASEPPEFAGRPKTDRQNPDEALRGRPILGLQLLTGLRPAGDGTFRGGTIYDPETGKTYRCHARIAEDGTLRLRGYVGVSLFGRTTTWTRVPE
jgi:uncharacterized protein (DUF2147 family)